MVFSWLYKSKPMVTGNPVALVPTDFSDSARNATDYAMELARHMNYDVLLLHVYNTPVVESPGMVGVLPIDLMQIEKDVEKRMKAEVKFLRKRSKVQIRYECVNGFVEDEILVAEEKHK